MSKFTEWAPRMMRDLMAEPRFNFGVFDAAAIVGNGAYESGGFEKMQEIAPTVKGSRGGWGLFQWTGPRRKSFEAWVARKKFKPDSYEANYSFLIRELLTSEKKAVAAVKGPVKLDDKVVAFENAFERAGVKAYAKRKEWARKALAAFNASEGTVPAPKPVPAPTPVPHVPAPAPQGSWLSRLFRGMGLLPKVPTQPVVQPGAYDPIVERVQKRLQELGYPEVGLADGRYGKKTRDAIIAFALEQKPSFVSKGEVNDALHAALAKAQPRAVAANRANVTAKDLRQAGNEQANALSGMGWLGQAMGVGGFLGGLEKLGVFNSLKDAADTTTSTLSTIGAIASSIIGAIQWTVEHWWLFAILAGVWTVYRVTVAVLNLVVLFRQGILQRAALLSPDV